MVSLSINLSHTPSCILLYFSINDTESLPITSSLSFLYDINKFWSLKFSLSSSATLSSSCLKYIFLRSLDLFRPIPSTLPFNFYFILFLLNSSTTPNPLTQILILSSILPKLLVKPFKSHLTWSFSFFYPFKNLFWSKLSVHNKILFF
ncbi:unnamed protein product [Moneuplotes crassus]|uniref:Uncharacterized protein n=1 Tax=Euplotes crassus TaxID=5936 RepID=A0AAD1XIH2_EUPCR|nr:unnamed protein product [Moneuplotes crassus]